MREQLDLQRVFLATKVNVLDEAVEQKDPRVFAIEFHELPCQQKNKNRETTHTPTLSKSKIEREI